MRRHLILFIIVALAGCKGDEQKQRDIAAQLRAVNDQLQKDCPKFDEKDNTGVSAALGQTVTPEQRAAAEQRKREIHAKLDSPHCKELQAKVDDLYKQG